MKHQHLKGKARNKFLSPHQRNPGNKQLFVLADCAQTARYRGKDGAGRPAVIVLVLGVKHLKNVTASKIVLKIDQKKDHNLFLKNNDRSKI